MSMAHVLESSAKKRSRMDGIGLVSGSKRLDTLNSLFIKAPTGRKVMHIAMSLSGVDGAVRKFNVFPQSYGLLLHESMSRVKPNQSIFVECLQFTRLAQRTHQGWQRTAPGTEHPEPEDRWKQFGPLVRSGDNWWMVDHHRRQRAPTVPPKALVASNHHARPS